MQSLKQKYPEYKNFPDSELLKLVAKKHPVYQPILDKYNEQEASNLKISKRSAFTDSLKDTAGKIGSPVKKAFSDAVEPSNILNFINPAFSALEPETRIQVASNVATELGEHLERPSGGMRGLVAASDVKADDNLIQAAGRSFSKGFMEPGKQQTMGESVLDAYPQIMELKDPIAVGIIAGTIGTIAEFGSLHLIYNSLPKAVASVTKAIKGTYTSAQGTAMNKLISQLTKELEPVLGKVKAEQFAKVKVYQEAVKPGFLRKTPRAINKTTQVLQKNTGKIAKAMLKAQEEATVKAGTAGVKQAWQGTGQPVISNIEKVTQVSNAIVKQSAPMLDPMIKAQADKFIAGASAEVAAVVKAAGGLGGKVVPRPEGPIVTFQNPDTQDTFAMPVKDATVGSVVDKMDSVKAPAKAPASNWKSQVGKHNIKVETTLKNGEATGNKKNIEIETTQFNKGDKKLYYKVNGKPAYIEKDGKLKVVNEYYTKDTRRQGDPIQSHTKHLRISKYNVIEPEVKAKAPAANVRRAKAIIERDKQGKIGKSKQNTAAVEQAKAIVAKAETSAGLSKEEKVTLSPAVRRRNVEADGTMWHKGNKGVEVTDEILKEKITDINNTQMNQDRMKRLKAIKKLPDDVGVEALRKHLEVDTRHTKKSEAIADIEAQLDDSHQYISDAKLANKLYNAKAPVLKTKAIQSFEDTVDKLMDENPELSLVEAENMVSRQGRDAQSLEDDMTYPERELDDVEQFINDEARKFLNDKGFAGTPDVQSMITDVQGLGEELTANSKRLAKRFGAPFWIGQKYPAFAPVYGAVQDAIDMKAEHFFEGSAILNPREHLKLPKASQQRVSDALKLGNSVDYRNEFTPENLRMQFGFSDGEVKAYQAVRAVYKYATNLEIESRRYIVDYMEMDPEHQQAFDDHIKKQVGKLKGYMSQTRNEGKWAVYAPPEEGSESAKFFNLYPSKSAATKAAQDLGDNSKVYLRQDLRSTYKHLTVADLEGLIEASDIDSRSPDLTALRNELKKRTFSAHWIQRKDIPGYDWGLNNIMESAINYLEGSANKYARMTGRHNADVAFKEQVGNMDPSLSAYARDWIDAYYSSGAVGYKGFNKLIYSWKLAFKTSWLAQNLTQPIATTYPWLAKYYPGLGAEKAFLRGYGQAMRYNMYKLNGKASGLNPKLIQSLNILHKQGVLGDQLTRFQLGIKNLKQSDFEQWIGLFGRMGESVNRTHAATVGFHVATNQLKLTDPQAIMNFMKTAVNSTQFAYGKQNLPLLITTSRDMKNVMRTAYTFKHYIVNYLQMLNSMGPHRGAKWSQFARALGTLLAQAGIKGAPFWGLITLAYKKIFGRTADQDMRTAMKEAGMNDKVIDLALHGGWSLAGIDASNLVGAGDIIPTFGSDVEKIGGAAVGFATQMGKAMNFAIQGDRRALEYASPDAIKNVLKGVRFAKEGIRNSKNELIAMPSEYDSVLRGLGFTPMSESKAWLSREAKNTIKEADRDKASKYHQKMAWASYKKDKKEYKRLLDEASAKGVRINTSAIRDNIKSIFGFKQNIPRKHRGEFGEVDKLFNVKKKR